MICNYDNDDKSISNHSKKCNNSKQCGNNYFGKNGNETKHWIVFLLARRSLKKEIDGSDKNIYKDQLSK